MVLRYKKKTPKRLASWPSTLMEYLENFWWFVEANENCSLTPCLQNLYFIVYFSLISPTSQWLHVYKCKALLLFVICNFGKNWHLCSYNCEYLLFQILRSAWEVVLATLASPLCWGALWSWGSVWPVWSMPKQKRLFLE